MDLVSSVLTSTRQTGSTASIKFTSRGSSDARVIRVGLMAERDGIAAPEVADARFDDPIHIYVSRESGVIAGINPRSVLIAVYRYLSELGGRPRLDLLAFRLRRPRMGAGHGWRATR
jgi:hypothetical protein